jgi:uncharacterized coiled-coil protein SlyX
MLRKDYLTAQIEELARIMAKLLTSISGLTLEDAIKSLEQTLAESNIKLDNILDMSDAEIIATIEQNPAFDAANIEALSDVLAALAQKSDAAKHYRKSLFLLEYINTVHKIFSFERNAKINRLKSRP